MVKRLTIKSDSLTKVLNQSLWKDVEIKEQQINNHAVVDVHLTNDMLITALTFGTRIHQKANALKLIQTIQGGVKEDIIGLEGALAVAAYLHKNWLVALDNLVIGKGDSGDITYEEKVIDVKTRGKPENDLLMVPEKQWNKHKDKCDLYIGCNEIAEDWVRIWGYATKEEIASAEVEDFGCGPTKIVPFVNLHPIKDLRDELASSESEPQY